MFLLTCESVESATKYLHELPPALDEMTMRLDAGQIEVLDEGVATALRVKSEAERLNISFRMWAFARELIENVLRSEHADWDEDQLQREVARRLSHGAI